MKFVLVRFSTRRRAAALVIVLAFIVLLTGLILTFLIETQQNRKIAKSETGQVQAKIFGRGMERQVEGDLRQEIAAGSLLAKVNGVTLYRPKAPSNAVPARVGTNDAFPNLIKVSRGGVSFFPDENAAFPASKRASEISTQSASANGRFITAARWNRAYLLPQENPGSADASPPESFVPPDWIYMTRNGTNPTTWKLGLKNSANDEFVVGRYAYAIYDEGGLLDLNAAGYPMGNSLKNALLANEQIGGKGSLAFADLSQIGLTPLQINKILSWRNFASAQASDDSPYFNKAAAQRYFSLMTNRTDGFLGVLPTPLYKGRSDRRFVDRQHLIQFMNSQIGATAAKKALPVLGTFSREINAPSLWSSTSPLANIRVQKPFQRADGAQAKIGDPLIANRFPLGRLLAIGKTGVNTNAQTTADGKISAANAKTVQRDFGLRWNAAQTRWDYVGSSGDRTQSKIETLNEVAKEDRAPNFFELLQAGISAGSLGDFANGDWKRLPIAQQKSTTLQILTIGANMICQTRSDSFPVRIAISEPAGESSGSAVWEAVGSQRLPYLDRFSLRAIGNSGAANSQMTWALIPMMWDPYQSALSLPKDRPRIRITVQGSVQTLARDSNGALSPVGPIVDLPPTSLPLPDAVRDGCAETDFLNPAQFSSGEIAVSETGWSVIQDSPPAIVFKIPIQLSTELKKTIAQKTPFLQLSADAKRPFQIALEYQDANGGWHPYSFLQGINDPATWMRAIALRGTSKKWNANGDLASKWNVSGLNESAVFVKADPRSSRFNSQIGTGNPKSRAKNPWMAESLWKTRSPGGANGLALDSDSLAAIVPGYRAPKNFEDNAVLYPARWSRNSGGGNGENYADRDGVVRLADGGLFANSDGKKGNPFNNEEDRPLILNRPFRNVGEIGYVFRDQPFKSIDFFSEQSGDAALLDLFCVNETPQIRAGVVNLNTRNEKVLSAILAGTSRAENKSVISPSDAKKIAQQLVEHTKREPFLNPADLPAFVQSLDASALTTSNDWKIKTQREAIVRALSGSTQTRTWNLMIDLIAQVGRFSPNATRLDQFSVTAEKRYWVHVAIDRLTGKVISRQVEPVDE